MARIVYLLFSAGGLQGGHKIIVRHVEALRDLGFNAVCYIGQKTPDWFSHRASMVSGEKIQPGDIIVVPDDAPNSIRICNASNFQTVLFSQGLYNFAANTFREVDRFPADRFPPFIVVGPRMVATLKRAYPNAAIELVPCFADERLFRPSSTKTQRVAFTPRKRPLESSAIQNLLGKFHPRHRALPWFPIHNMQEAEAAAAFADSTLCLSLNRLESVGMTTLEAMASGCLCAGFTGVGGDDYATPENGFWVPNEYCEAAADALAQAADLAQTGGPALNARLEAGYETARLWSYAAFRVALEATWMRLAPGARLQSGPLDPI